MDKIIDSIPKATKKEFFHEGKLSALEAKYEAQKLAFAPIAFQATMVLRNTGILSAIFESKTEGLTLNEIVEKTSISAYGVRVLIESGLANGVLIEKNEKFILSKVGFFILHDEMTVTNFDFVQDVCYEGMYYLDEAIKKEAPSGLKVFGKWSTVYEALAHMSEKFRKSWFGFDHFYSDRSFSDALRIVFNNKVDTLLDIGGNTGKWATQCVNNNKDVNVTMFDLPGQLETAKTQLSTLENKDRIHFCPGNLLDPDVKIPKDFNIYWMSQFLDCFGEQEIISILSRIKTSMGDDSRVYIMETFWDDQSYDAAAYSLIQTSLYFTCIANGNSKMYGRTAFEELIHDAGLVVETAHEHVGIGHTILVCKKPSSDQPYII